MAALPEFSLRFTPPVPRYLLFASATSLGTLLFLRSINRSLGTNGPNATPSPLKTALPRPSAEEVEGLPYPPDPLPGRRDVDSPLGSTRIYEWGPEAGRKILLIHGISTPSIALADLAHKLVDKGCRVMLFDLFGRGYSSGPSTKLHRHDSSLYATQILICIQSSPIPWQSFSLIGYSLGGALAADFTSYFPNLIESLILVAPGGLIRTTHITWKSKLLYSTSGIVPEWMIERLVAKRLWTGPETARSIEPEPDTDATVLGGDETKGGLNTPAVYTTSHHGLLRDYAHSTASKVVDWQIQHHRGFVPAFISGIRYAPIHDQQHRWRVIRQNMENRVGRLNEVHLVLGETDPIIVAEELVQDAGQVLGEQNLKIKIVEGVGHEVAISNADAIAQVVEGSL